MGKVLVGALAFCLTCTAFAAPSGFIAAETKAADFGQISTPGYFELGNSALLETSTGNDPVATVKFNGLYAKLGQTFSTPRNWSNYTMARMRLQNHEGRPVRIKLIVQVKPNLNDYSGAFDGEAYLNPFETRTFVFVLNSTDAKPYGLKALPPVLDLPYVTVLDGNTLKDYSKVYHWRLSLQDTLPATVSVQDFSLMSFDTDFTGISDQFGQYTRRFWSDRITSQNDLLNKRALENLYLNSKFPADEIYGTSRFGAPETAGRWRLEKGPSGKWYIVTPFDRFMWSLGVSAVHDDQYTPVEGRANYFTNLPSESGWTGAFYEVKQTNQGPRKSYNFMRQNLTIKYGQDYGPAWIQTLKRRLPAWGFNTVGIQSDERLYDSSMPYTVILSTDDFPKRLSTPYVHWNKLPDPYDPNFQSWTDAKMAAGLAKYNRSTGFMGVYVDNELSWGDESTVRRRYNVALGALNAPSSQPAKAALISYLTNKYGSVSKLNSAWGTSFSSWSSVQNLSGYYPSSVSGWMKVDFEEYQRQFAVQYFRTVRVALNRAGCTGLYLGSRFSGYTPEAVRGAALYCNVLSYNFYRYASAIPWDYLETVGRPVMISEWCFTALDRGSFGGAPETPNYLARAAQIRAWLSTAVSRPNIIGVQWYSYADQPITGRWSDGENMGRGLVDIADTPYYETVDVFRDISLSLYQNRG
jgi:hypothetical protein